MRFTVLGFVLSLLIILDAYLTELGIKLGAVEMNPLSSLLINYGVYYIVKFMLCVVVMYSFIRVDNSIAATAGANVRLRSWIRVLMLGAVLVIILYAHAVINNIWVILWLVEP